MNEYFLDQGVIIGYADSIFDSNKQNKQEAGKELVGKIDIFAEASVKFIETKEEKTFSTCFYIVKHDLPKFLARRALIIEEIRRKIKDSDYGIGSSEIAKKYLYPRDIAWANKIFLIKDLLKGKEKELSSFLLEIETVFKRRIAFFINKILNKVVIPIKDIERDLMWHFHSFINNYSDCNVIASAVQCNTNLFRILVITTDKKDWQNIKECLDTNLTLSQKYKAPKWLYLLDAVERKG